MFPRTMLTLSVLAMLAMQAALAAPFDPEVQHRPRLMLEQEDLSTVRARVQRAPYSGWLAGLRSRSNQTPIPYEGYDVVREYANGNIAKAAAFVALVDEDGDAALRARDVLLICETSIPNLTLNPLLIGDDIHLAEALMLYAQACDLLFASGYLSPTDSTAVHDRVAGLTRSTYQRYVKENPFQYHLTMNNHRSKLAAAVGMAALTFNQDNDASLWIDWGMTVVDAILRHQTVASDGTFGEGPDYLSYAAVNHLPFAWAYHLFRDGVGGVFTYRQYGLFGWVVFSEERELENPITSPLYAAIDDWGVAIRRFDGKRSPMDDSNPVGYFNFYGATVRDDEILAWDWWEADQLRVDDVADLRADVICVADDLQSRSEPGGGPTIFLPAGGHAILRQGWGPNDARVHVLAEYEQSRVAGGLHEHPDATSFMIEAHGEALALDSGYGRWEDRLRVNNAENHNLVLIDGQGPPSPELIPPIGVDAAQDLQADTEHLDAVRVMARYRNTDVRRIVATFDHRWVAVLDHVAPDGGSHLLEWMLHGNGGGSTDGSFALTEDGARWDRSGASLIAHIGAGRGGPPQLSGEEMTHGLTWGSLETHMTLRAAVSAPGATFAVLLEHPAAGEGEALVRDLSRSGSALLLCTFPGGERALLSSRESNTSFAMGPLAFDGHVGLFVERAPRTPGAMLVTSATDVLALGLRLLQAAAPIDLTLSWEAERTSCHIEQAAGIEVVLWVGCAVQSVEGAVNEWQNLPGGRVRFVPAGDAVDLVFYCN